MSCLILIEQFPEEHGPLARTRPVFELRCGAWSLARRLERYYQAAQTLHGVRDHLAEVHRHLLEEQGRPVRVNPAEGIPPDDLLLLDGAVLAGNGAALPDLEGDEELGVIRDVVNHRPDSQGRPAPVLRSVPRPLYLRLRRDTAARVKSQWGPDPRTWMGALRTVLAAAGESLPAQVEIAGRPVSCRHLDPGEIPVMTYPWTLIAHNGRTLTADFAAAGSAVAPDAVVDPGVVWLRHGRRLPPPGEGAEAAPVHIGRRCTIGAFVSFDVSEGPVFLDDEVTVESHCHIKGPAYIGPGSTLWAFTDLKESCSLGPRCRVCGQVEEVIFQGYMHKFHVGFVGHSYLGEGVNLGDQTVTSNLKNDRTPVEVHLGPEPARHIDTGTLYAGALIGDGSATGTNTNLTTGAVVEPLSTIVSARATPKYVSGLFTDGRHLIWPFTQAYQALRVLVAERLGRDLPPGHQALYHHVYQEMKPVRRQLRLRDTRRVGG